MYENPTRENGRPWAESARPTRYRLRVSPAQGLALAWFALGCSLSDPYFVDPDYGSTGGGGASDGGANNGGAGNGGMTSGGNSFGGAVSGGGAGGGGGGASGEAGKTDKGSKGGTGGGTDCAPDCKGTCCGTKCVDLTKDALHCGSCETPCSAGRTCTASACASGWVPSAPPPATFVGRQKAAYAAMGEKIFIWGGVDDNNIALDDGAIYDPVNDSWNLISTDTQTPSPRQLATAVWTGKAMLVFGGRNATSTAYYRDAALYDPVADSWSSAGSAQAARASGAGGATPSTVVFYGGLTTDGGGLQGTARYSIGTNTWPATATMSAPAAMIGITTGFTSDSMFCFGGQESATMRSNQAYRYDIQADTWTTLPLSLSERAFAFGVSDGTNFFVWAGRDALGVRADGAVYAKNWTTIVRTNAPTARGVGPRQSGWSFALEPGVAAFLGGLDTGLDVVKNGGIYSITDGWSAIPSWPSGEGHEWAVAARAGGELFLWSGADTAAGTTTTGERWAR